MESVQKRVIFTSYKDLQEFSQFQQIVSNNIHTNICSEIVIQTVREIQEPTDSQFIVQKIFQVLDSESVPFQLQQFIQINKYFKNIGGVVLVQKTIASVKEDNVQQVFRQLSKSPLTFTRQQNTIQVHRLFNINSYTTMRVILSFNAKQTNPDQFVQELQRIRSNIIAQITDNEWKQLFEQADSKSVRIDIDQKVIEEQDIQIVVGISTGYQMSYMKTICELNKFYQYDKFQRTIKQLLKNPRQIQKKDIVMFYPWKHMIISPKADGIRCLLMLGQSNAEILTEKHLQSYVIPSDVCFDEYIFEAEIIGNKIFCYDLHMISGQRIFKLQYDKRLKKLEKAIQKLQSVKPGGYDIVLKPFVQIASDCDNQQLQKIFKYIADGQGEGFPQQTDGIIINQNIDYMSQQIFKWKPASQLTIDFYVEQYQTSNQNTDIIPFVLFSYIDIQSFKRHRFQHSIQPKLKTSGNTILIPFQPSIHPKCYIFMRNAELEKEQPIDGKVCEFNYDIVLDQWVLFRVREDKDPSKMQFGNYFSVAEETFFNIINYISLDDLCDIGFMNKMYFKQTKPKEFENMTKHINLIKRIVIQQTLKKGSAILDLGCGKGQDIHKYALVGINYAIMVDKDLDAIQELITRKNNTKSNDIYPQIEAYNVDLSDQKDSKFLISKISNKELDAIICNLAIHYFINNMQGILDIVSLLKQKGWLILTYLDGQRVFQQLVGKDSYSISDGNKTKYTIIKQYTENTFLDIGQQISIKLPFADNPYTELLVNSEFLKNNFQKIGMQVDAEFNLDMTGNYQLLKKSAAECHNSMNLLSDSDKKYVSLYKCLILSKV